jgi:hypothetical protein
MSWQAFSWTEIQARTPRLPERLLPAISLTNPRSLEALSLLASFLTPFAVMEAALGVWRLCADLGWAGEFFIERGLFSHWQVWFAVSIFTQLSSVFLSRALAKQAELVNRQE